MDGKNKQYDTIDLTPLIKPELNNGKIKFANFFNLKHTDHQDITLKFFNKLKSYDASDYSDNEFYFSIDGDFSCMKRYYINAVESKTDKKLFIFVKSFEDLEAAWTRIDVPVSLGDYPDVGFDLENQIVHFSKSYVDHD